MDYLIAPTLFKNKTCRLPGIGTLSIIDKCAETDYVNQKISAPQPLIIFSAPQDDEDMFNEFTALSKLIKEDLNKKETVALKGIGEFIKDEHGSIKFIPLKLDKYFFPSVNAKQKVEEDEQNALLLIDEKLTKPEIPALLVKKENKKSNWWIWAIVLGIVGLSVLSYYILQHGFNSLGNAVHYKIFNQILQY